MHLQLSAGHNDLAGKQIRLLSRSRCGTLPSGVLLMLISAAALASQAPALRAAVLDPEEALRTTNLKFLCSEETNRLNPRTYL